MGAATLVMTRATTAWTVTTTTMTTMTVATQVTTTMTMTTTTIPNSKSECEDEIKREHGGVAAKFALIARGPTAANAMRAAA